jgi:hypothetical protein
LREVKGFDDTPYQWAAAGYSGAINSGNTICGILFGSTAFLGFLHGNGKSSPPEVDDGQRIKAIETVNRLFKGFMEEFGTTDCRSLTHCDFSKKEEVDRFRQNEVYKHTCFKQFEFVLAYCLDHIKTRESL